MEPNDKVLCPWCGNKMELRVVAATPFDSPDDTEYTYRCIACLAESPISCGKESAYTAAMQRVEPPEGKFWLIDGKSRVEYDKKEWVPTPMLQGTYGVPMDHIAMANVEPENRVLTLEEITKSETDYFGAIPVWIEDIIENDITADTLYQDRIDLESYGKEWRCWLRKPTAEERTAAKWEE